MGMFIEVRVDHTACRAQQGCDLCQRVCPVEAFHIEQGNVSLAYEQEDECTLCNLCVVQCPAQAVNVVKLYPCP